MDTQKKKSYADISGIIVLAGGGTGGHLFPGISVAQELQNRCPKIEIEFYGTVSGLDSQIVERYGFKLKTIGLERRRSGLFGYFKLAINGLLSLRKCRRELKRHRPLAIIGLGGFAAATPVLAASWLGIPVFLLEQNAVPGRTNRYLSGRAERIYSQFEISEEYIKNKSKIEVLGNPVREELLRADVEIPVGWALEAGRRTVLVVGGSQGARNLNRICCEALPGVNGIQVLHIAGERDYEDVRRWYAERNFNATVLGFCDNMAAAYSSADVVISRAGATAISEICALGKASVLVPFPFAKDDHQSANARMLSEKDAAVTLDEKALTPGALAKELGDIIYDDDRLRSLSANAKIMGRPEASEKIVESILDCLQV